MPRWTIERLDTVPSTNDELKRRAAAGDSEGTVVVARVQTAGRGRDGRMWQSSSGGLWFSVLLRPDASIVSRLPMIFGLAALDSIAASAGRVALLKWPNDVGLDGGKLGGILIEPHWTGEALDFCVCGVGINVANAPVTLEDGSLSATLDGRCTPETLLTAFLEALSVRLAQAPATARSEYEKKCVTVGNEVELPEEHGGGRGRVLGVSEDGRLVVDRDGRRLLVSSLV